jgi:2'-5' RNA ligase
MRLFAAIVPPEPVRAELFSAVNAVAVGTAQLDIIPVDSMRLPITSFGNVTQRDCDQMLRALVREAVQWPRPTVRFSGSAALEFEGDRSVWSRVDGDLDSLFTVGRGVPSAVKRLGFLVDRRRFRPWLAVGTITETTSAAYLERLVAALDEFTGQLWTLESLSIIRRVPRDEAGQVDDVVIEEVPLGGD